MMRDPQNKFDYRRARKAFVALCQQAGSDSIARVHPSALGPDGKPLFIDSVAFGPRDAQKGVLVVTGRDGRDGLVGSAVLEALLKKNFSPLVDKRLVLVHALDPFGLAWQGRRKKGDPARNDAQARQSWSFAMLDAILDEDFKRGETLRVLDVRRGPTAKVIDASDTPLAHAIKAHRPDLDLSLSKLILAPQNAGFLGRKAVARALASL